MSVETSDSNGPRTWGKMLGNWLFQFMGAFTAAGTYRMVCFLDTGKDDGGKDDGGMNGVWEEDVGFAEASYLGQQKLDGGFKYFFIFIPTWGNDPIWLLFFQWVETTN